MNDFITTLLIIGTETAGMLMILFGIFVFINVRKHRQDKSRAMELVEKLKKNEEKKRDNLLLLLKESYGVEDDVAEKKVEELMQIEKTLYSKVLKMYMGRDRDAIKTIDRDVHSLIDNYRILLEGENVENEGEDGRVSTPLILRQENEDLRRAKAQLEADLAAAMETMENMMTEYSSMYEGGKKEGEQRVKNEMFKLQQKLENRVDVPELDEDIPELDGVVDLDEWDEKK